MDCSTEFIDFICEVLAPLGEVRSRKMMGDYVIYVNDKCVITACDNNAFINLKSASNLNGNLNCSKELEHYAS